MNTVETSLINERDAEATRKRDITRYIQASKDDLTKAVEEFCKKPGGKTVTARRGNWTKTSKDFVEHVKRGLSMPDAGVELPEEEKASLPEDVQFFMNLKEEDFGEFYILLCKILEPAKTKKTVKMSAPKKTGEKRTLDEADAVMEDVDAMIVEDSESESSEDGDAPIRLRAPRRPR